MNDIRTIQAAREFALKTIRYWSETKQALPIAQEALSYLVNCDHGPGTDKAIDEASSLIADAYLGKGEWEMECGGEVAIKKDRSIALDLTTEWPVYIDPVCEFENGEYRQVAIV